MKLIGYRDSDRRVHYYLGVDGKRGRAVCGPKKEAVRLDDSTAEIVMRQLPAVDNRDWQAVDEAPRCKFA